MRATKTVSPNRKIEFPAHCVRLFVSAQSTFCKKHTKTECEKEGGKVVKDCSE